MKHRLAACRALLDELNLDAILVSDATDVRYLSGFRGDDTALIVGREHALICTDSRYREQAREEAPHFALERSEGGLLNDSVAGVKRHFGGGAALGFQAAQVSHAQYRDLRRLHDGRLRDVGDRVARLRAVKDPGEIAAMRRAAAVTDEALASVVAGGLIGRRERDVAWDLLAAYHRLGAEGEAFPAIVAAGAHGAQPHAIPGDRVIAAGDLVVIDTGARVEGYCSDITRTYAAGEPTAEARRIHEIVLAAQLAGLAAVRAGAHGSRDVDAACRAVIDAAGHGDRFGHGAGHGVGLLVHEAPLLGRARGDLLAAGMVCTVEPGIYVEGVCGVRIEDTVLVTLDGCERLTMLPKELAVVA